MFIYESQRTQLSSIKSLDWLNESVNFHMQKLKANSDQTKVMQLLQVMSQYSVKTLGVSFLSNKSLASLVGVTTRTIRRYTATLVSLGIISKIATYRDRNKARTSNTYIILPVLKIQYKSQSVEACPMGCPDIKPSLKPTLKQDTNDLYTNNNKPNNIIYSIDEFKIFKLIKAKLQDKKIKNPSSYIDKMLKQHDLYTNRVQDTKHEREQRKNRVNEMLQQHRSALCFNWLES